MTGNGEGRIVFEYMYRDASNYKVYGSVVLTGHVTARDIDIVQAALNADGFFIPEFVALPPLQSQLPTFPSEDDHVWHEFLDLRQTAEQEAGQGCWGTLTSLVTNFAALEPWDSPDTLRRLALLFEQEPYSLFR